MNIAILASGTGSNAVKIIEHFRNQSEVNFIVISNKKDAPVLEKAKELGVESFYFGRKEFYEDESVINQLKNFHTELIILAGFLWLVPENILDSYQDRVVNIHPALLPNYGGKGMFGMNVHKAVVEAKDKQSGITIHFCNKRYDEGRHILQATCDVEEHDTPETLAKKIHSLEHFYFPRVVEKLIIDIKN